MSANTAAIQSLYVSYFNRPADARGLAYWEGVVAANGGNTSAVSTAFANSAEYKAAYANMSNFAIVAQVYQNIFGHSGDLAGVNYWTDRMDNHGLAIADVVAAIAGGAQGSDKTTFTNRVTAATAFTQQLDTTDEILAYEAPSAGNVGKSFLAGITTDASLAAATTPEALAAVMTAVQGAGPSTVTNLTAGIDQLVGGSGNDTFFAGEVGNPGSLTGTLTALDSLDGGAGVDALKVVQTADIDVTGVTVKNVENVSFTTGGKVTADISGWAGTLTANITQAAGAVDLTTGSATSVSIGKVTGGDILVTGAKTVTIANADVGNKVDIHTGSATTTANITGGSNITINKDGAAKSTTLTSALIKGATGNIAITSDAVNSVSLTDLNTDAKKVDIVNVNAAGHDLALTLNDVGYDTDGNELTTVNLITDTTAKNVNVTTAGAASSIKLVTAAATALTVAGDQALAANLSGLTAVKSITVSGAAGLTSDLTGLANLATVDASASTGDNAVTVDATALTVKMGSGDDSVTLNAALADKQVITLGAGDDTLVLAAVTATTTGSVDGGEGNNTIAATNGDFLSKNYTNFQTLEIGGGQKSYDMSTLAGLKAVTIGDDLAAAASIVKAVAGTTVTFNAAAHTDLGVTQDLSFALATATGTSDSVSVTLNAKDGNNDGAADGVITAKSFTANAIETFNIASHVVKLDADKASTPNTDESTVASDYVNTITTLSGDAVKTINVTGEAGVSFAVKAANLTKIDASSNTGGVTVDASDTGNLKGVTFLGSSGVDTYTATANGDNITGGKGADIINLDINGKDTIRYTAVTDSVLTLKDTDNPADGIANTASGFDVVNGFVSGSDKIELSSALTLATGDARAALAVHGAIATGAAALQAAIGDGVDFFGAGTSRAVATITDGTDLYVFADVNHDGNYTAGSDLVIKLAGITSIVLSDVAFG